MNFDLLITEISDMYYSLLEVITTHVISVEGSFAMGLVKGQQPGQTEGSDLINLNGYNELAHHAEEYVDGEYVEEDSLDIQGKSRPDTTSKFGFRG